MATNITELAFKMTANARPFLTGIGEVSPAIARVAAGVSKQQGILGAWRDENTLLRNSFGQLVEGLSTWQVAMGYTTDEEGRLFNANGKLIDGLSALQQKLGYYKDAIGNVYNAQGDFITESEETSKKIRELAESFEKAAEEEEKLANAARQEGIKAAQELGKGLQWVTNTLVTFSSGSDEAQRNLRALSAGMTVFTSIITVLPKINQWYKAMTIATKGQTAAQIVLNAVTGNFVGIVAGAVATAGAITYLSYQEMGDAAESSSEKIENLTDNVSKLQKEAEKLGNTNWGIEEVQSLIEKGIGVSTQSLLDNITGLPDEIEKRKNTLSAMGNDIIDLQNSINEMKTGDTYWDYWFNNDLNAKDVIQINEEILAQRKKQWDELKKQDDQGIIQGVQNLVNNIISSQQSQSEKIQEQIKVIEAAREGNIISQETSNKAMNALSQQLADEQTKQQKKAEQEAANLLKPLEQYKKEVEKVTTSFAWMDKITDEATLSSEAYKNALQDRTKKLAEAQNKDSLGEEEYSLMKEVNKKYVESQDLLLKQNNQLYDLRNKGKITEEVYQKALKDNQKSLANSSEFGSFLLQAKEELVPVKEKFQKGLLEIANQGLISGFSVEEIKKAQDLYTKSLNNKNTQKTDSVERGSLDAYKVVNNNQDKTTKAIKEQTTALARVFQDGMEMLSVAYSNSADMNNYQIDGVV
jgi:hypothetical protein